MSKKEDVIFSNGIAYVPMSEFNDVWNVYIKELEENESLQTELKLIKKENVRLKRIERRQQDRWNREHNKAQ